VWPAWITRSSYERDAHTPTDQFTFVKYPDWQISESALAIDLDPRSRIFKPVLRIHALPGPRLGPAFAVPSRALGMVWCGSSSLEHERLICCRGEQERATPHRSIRRDHGPA
jgi:hypothetical protein